MIHTEPLSGGLVTSRGDGSLLEVGELRLATNGVYRPDLDGICPIKARDNFGGSQSGAVTGLRAIPFDGEADFPVLIVRATNWIVVQAVAGDTNVGSSKSNATRIEAIHTNNKYVLSNGVAGQAAVLSSDLTSIGHGMVASEADDFNLSAQGAGGGWNSDTGLGFFWYWITEYDSVNDIESAATGDDVVEVLAISDTIRVAIQYGLGPYVSLHNANADKWRIYRAGPTASSEGAAEGYDTQFPIGLLVGTADIPETPGITNFDDDGTPGTTPYRILSISAEGSAAVDISRDGVPPTFNTGDIFEDQLVVNDITEEAIVRYSYPGLIHSFPSLYFVRPGNTKQHDKVTYIRALGEVCVVGLENQIWRLNYLPNETDSEFHRGRCKQPITSNHGIMGFDAATLFTIEDGAPLLAYVSHDGLHMTNGFKTFTLTDDLKWDDLVALDELDQSLLVNHQDLFCLLFYYSSKGTTFPNDSVLALSYHPRHLKEGGKLKVAGPWSLTTYAADYGDFKAFVGNALRIKVEDQGALQTMSLKTRLIYPQQRIDTETSIERIWALTGEATTEPDLPPVNAITRIEGFEGGSTTYLDGQGGSAFSVVTSPVKTGVYALQLAPVDAGSHFQAVSGRYTATGEQDTTDKDVMMASFKLYINSLAASDDVFFSVANNAGTARAALSLTSAGQIDMDGDVGETVLATGTWHHIDILVDNDAGNKVLKINGVQELQSSTVSGTMRQVLLGRNAAGPNPGASVVFDDVILQLQDTAADVEFMRQTTKILRLDPVADGTDDGTWTSTTTPDEWDSVDETPDNGDTDLMLSTTGADSQTVTLEASAPVGISGTILATSLAAVVRKTGAPAASYELRIRSGATTDDATVGVAPASYANRTRVDTVDPDTSSRWTTDALDAIEVGLDHPASAGTLRCTALDFQVAFAP